MIRLSRRFPVPVAPLPFFLGLVLLVVGLLWGLNWTWRTDRFTGNLLLQLLIAGPLLRLSPARLVWFLGGVLGLATLVVSFLSWKPRVVARTRLLARSLHLYPLVLGLALLLVVSGLIYVFDVALSADAAPGGFVLLVAFNYADLGTRLVQTLFGLLVLALGAVLLWAGPFGRRRDTTAVAPFTPQAQPETTKTRPL